MEYKVTEFPNDRAMNLQGKCTIDKYIPDGCSIPPLKVGDILRVGPYTLDGMQYCSVIEITEDEEE